MSLFILIHTSLETAFVALAENDKIISFKENHHQREHGSFLHQAIEEILKEEGKSFKDLSAIGVTAGPGSYTGIRVGLSAAKGLGYSLSIPLVLCSTLMGLAATAVDIIKDKEALYVPLIHARKTEYYFGVYNYLAETVKPDSLTDVQKADKEWGIDEKKIYFFGIQLEEFSKCTGLEPAINVEDISPESLARLINSRFERNETVSPEAAAPLYLKEAFILGR